MAVQHGHRVIASEGVELPARRVLNFTGAGVVVTDNAPADQSVATIAAGGAAGFPLAVALALNAVWTNMPAAATELLGTTATRPRVDLSAATQFRLVARVAAAGAAAADLRPQGSTDGSTFSNLDGGAGPELTLSPTGDKDTGWVTLAAAFRVDNVRMRIMGKEGDGALDPRFSVWIFFRA